VFNVSHSDELALFAVASDREVGIDVERVRPVTDPEQIADHFFSAPERTALRAVPPDRRLEAFFDCWTRKEAYVKARGDGLAHPLDQFAVSLGPGEPARFLPVAGYPTPEPSAWSLQALAPGNGYVAALAAEGHGWRTVSRRWPDPPATRRAGG
jgi:4'-phosphopantetheinyl transferase